MTPNDALFQEAELAAKHLVAARNDLRDFLAHSAARAISDVAQQACAYNRTINACIAVVSNCAGKAMKEVA
jgi:hypothetical protein